MIFPLENLSVLMENKNRVAKRLGEGTGKVEMGRESRQEKAKP